MKAALLVASLLLAVPAAAQTDHEALQRAHDILSVQLTKRTISVGTVAQLAAALADVHQGDTIRVAPGNYPIRVELPPVPGCAGDGPVCATLTAQGSLPKRKIETTDAWQLPTFLSINIPDGVHRWTIDGVRLSPTSNTFGVIRCGSASGHANLDAIPQSITLDRVLIEVGPTVQERRGIQGNCANLTLRRSTVLGVKEEGADSQAFAAWDTPGPILIEDTDLEGAGENFLLGGSDPSIQGMTPSDITLRRVRLTKPDTWRNSTWTIKNLLEIKHGRRVHMEDIYMAGIWPQAQTGWAVLFTVRNQGGTCPWCVVDDVTLERFTLERATSGINLLGTDNEQPSAKTTNVTIRNGLMRLEGKKYGGDGAAFMFLAAGALDNVTIDHVTAFHDGSIAIVDAGGAGKMPHFVMTNSIFFHNAYGIVGSGTSPGNATLAEFFDKPTLLKTVIAGATQAGYLYPSGNYTPTVATAQAQFQPDGSLKPTSVWKRAGTDGKDLGATLSR